MNLKFVHIILLFVFVGTPMAKAPSVATQFLDYVKLYRETDDATMARVITHTFFDQSASVITFSDLQKAVNYIRAYRPCTIRVLHRMRAQRTASHVFKLKKFVPKISVCDVCPICLTDVRSPVRLSCSHVYCNECMNFLLRSSGTTRCPMCRTPINTSEIVGEENPTLIKSKEGRQFQRTLARTDSPSDIRMLKDARKEAKPDTHIHKITLASHVKCFIKSLSHSVTE